MQITRAQVERWVQVVRERGRQAQLSVTLAPARAQQADTAGPHLEVAAGDVSVVDLVERWAAARKQVAQVDPQLAQQRVSFSGAARLDRAALRHVPT